MNAIFNKHNRERTLFRIDTIANGHNPIWVRSRKYSIPQGTYIYIQLLINIAQRLAEAAFAVEN